jgi:hypothetical protein
MTTETEAERKERKERNLARTAKARDVLMRRTDEKIAARLREHGWTCTPPEPDRHRT